MKLSAYNGLSLLVTIIYATIFFAIGFGAGVKYRDQQRPVSHATAEQLDVLPTEGFVVANDDVVVGAPERADPSSDAGTKLERLNLERQALSAILVDVNETFKAKTGGQKELRFTVYWSTRKPNKAAIVLNDVLTPDGKVSSHFATFFYQDESGWSMIPDSFDR